MKYLLVCLLTIYICSCSQTTANTAKSPTPETAPTADIDKAVHAFLDGSSLVKAVHGISLHRQTDDYYVVGADVERPNGMRDVEQLIVRRYDNQGRKYWKAEDLTMKVIEALRDPEKEDK